MKMKIALFLLGFMSISIKAVDEDYYKQTRVNIALHYAQKIDFVKKA